VSRLVTNIARCLYPRGTRPWRVSVPGTSWRTLRRLGYEAGTRLLIVSADDFGMCGSVNRAIVDALSQGIVTSTAAMVPCPSFSEVAEFARSHRDADIGIHLTLTSEWKTCRWRPVLGAERVPSLVDSDGCFWSTGSAVFAHASLNEVEAELRAQIDTAIRAGIEITHLDSHMFVLHGKRTDYYRLYLKLAREYRLAFRSIRRTLLHWLTRIDVGALRTQRFGVTSPDHLVFGGLYDRRTAFDYWSSVLRSLSPGLTEVYCHPGFARGRFDQFAEDADERQADFDFFTSDTARRLLHERDVHLTTFREIGDRLLRTQPSSKPVVTAQADER
jgi:predicted glycoside hydrolase/deacetylase ChbG (UPF0249 family)